MLSGVSCCPSIKCVDDSAEAPCWGDVYVVDEDYDGDDYYWVHACEGHADVRMGVPYRPAPTKYLAKAARAAYSEASRS